MADTISSWMEGEVTSEKYEEHMKLTRARDYAAYLALREKAVNSRPGRLSGKLAGSVREINETDRMYSGREWHLGRPYLRSYNLGTYTGPAREYDQESDVKVEWYPTDSYVKEVDRVLNRVNAR